MTRFLPAQIQLWTGGQLVQSPENQRKSEHFYRGISTDSRRLRKDEIFLALRGERFDGHDFIREAIVKGVGMLVLDEASPEAMSHYHALSAGHELPDLLLVPDTLTAYQQIAAGYRQTLLASLIAITGSVGKTTTRRMVNAVVSTQMKTHETEENKNNQIGVPLTLLDADDEDEVIIAELGMDRRGEIETLSLISHPDIAVITSIGYSHAEYLGSRENILREKSEIVAGMRSNGLVLINGQDEHLAAWARENRARISVWRIVNDLRAPAADLEDVPCFWAEEIEIDEKNTHFTAKSSLDPTIHLRISIPAPGKYLVRAALFALAAAYALGLDMEVAAKGCADFSNTGSRQLILHLGQRLVIDDSYNASPESLSSALDTLAMLAGDGRRKIACLGGMKELGSYARDLHLEVGRKVAKVGVDELYLVGAEALWIEEGLRESNTETPVHLFDSSEALIEKLLPVLGEEDAVLLKGSRIYAMEKIRFAMEKTAAATEGRI